MSTSTKNVRRRNRSPLAHRELLTGLAFITPGLIGFLIFVLIPVVFSLYLSFTDWNFMRGFDAIEFSGLKNYTKLFSDPWFRASYRNNLVFTLVTIPILTALGLVLANFLNRHVIGGTKAQVFYFIPYICSVVAISVVWQVLFHPSFGPINQTLRMIGIENPPKWLADFHWALPAVMIVYIWQNVGYYAVVYMAGLKSVSADVYEAAEIDGAGSVTTFFKITVPLVAPTTFFLVTMGIIGSFKVFDHISVMTEGGPGNATSVMAFYIYRKAFEEFDMGYANTLAWALFVLIFVVTVVQYRLQRNFSAE